MLVLSPSTQWPATCQHIQDSAYTDALNFKTATELKTMLFFFLLSFEVILLHPIKFYYFSIVLFSLHCCCFFEDIKRFGGILLLSFIILDFLRKNSLCSNMSDLGRKIY